MLSTTNIPVSGSGVPKTLQPGNTTCTIKSVMLEKVPYKLGGYNLILNLEGPNLGSDFEGFFIDKEDQSKGKYDGQIGKVKVSEYPFADGETKTGIKVSRDLEILKSLQHICKEVDCIAWLEKQDNQHSDIESLVEQFNSDKPFKNKEISVCLGGKEYTNKAGYMNYDLYLPRPQKSKASLLNAQGDLSKLMVFEEEVHIKKIKPAEEVSSFGSEESTDIPVTSSVAQDFKVNKSGGLDL